MNISTFSEILDISWTKETCVPSLKDKYSDENKSLGQCAITALLVNDYFGGKIMRCMTSTGSHYYNLINDEIIDFTVEQFLGEIPMYEQGEERTREYLLSNNDTKKRYLLLRKNFIDNKVKKDSERIDVMGKVIRKKIKKYEKMMRDNNCE